jgi:hypothetical protein
MVLLAVLAVAASSCGDEKKPMERSVYVQGGMTGRIVNESARPMLFSASYRLDKYPLNNPGEVVGLFSEKEVPPGGTFRYDLVAGYGGMTGEATVVAHDTLANGHAFQGTASLPFTIRGFDNTVTVFSYSEETGVRGIGLEVEN